MLLPCFIAGSTPSAGASIIDLLLGDWLSLTFQPDLGILGWFSPIDSDVFTADEWHRPKRFWRPLIMCNPSIVDDLWEFHEKYVFVSGNGFMFPQNKDRKTILVIESQYIKWVKMNCCFGVGSCYLMFDDRRIYLWWPQKTQAQQRWIFFQRSPRQGYGFLVWFWEDGPFEPDRHVMWFIQPTCLGYPLVMANIAMV